MAVDFVPAKILRSKYKIFGSFYSINMPGVEPVKCRRVLEITAESAITIESKPMADAVFVMMNPGASRPEVGADRIVIPDEITEMSTELISTVPDTTQYQVMRIMHYKKWEHVRVINLSDLCDPKSGSFFKRYVQLERERGGEVHSVFSSKRSVELKKYLSRRPLGPIVCAWGVSDNLNLLINRASVILSLEAAVIGWPKSGYPGKYFHPLPLPQCKKEQWVSQMLKLLNT